MTVSQILGAMSGGDSIETILADYSVLSMEDIMVALVFANHVTQLEESPYEMALA